jgi:hypothetical protein
MARGVNVADHLLGHRPLLRAGVEDFGAILRTNDAFIEVSAVNLKRDSIEAHLTIVFAALAVSRWIEGRTGWSIKKFVRAARRYRTIQIQAGLI